ncbi:hypothetical protein ACWD9K_37525 [Streptomyces sp. 900116325]
MTRTKKYAAAAAITAAVVGVPTMAEAITSPVKVTVAATAKTGASTSAEVSKKASSVRVVAPGERVQAAPGVQLWLTKEGKHWSTPIQADQFRSVIDGNFDLSQPGVSLQAEPIRGRYFPSGIYSARVTRPA